MEHRDMQYVNMRSLQERPITLGELLLREENMEAMETPPPRSMGRSLSPTRCLGPLASGRPRRSRGRTLTRASTSTGHFEDGPSEFLPHRRRTPADSLTLPALTRWRNATAEARIRNFHSLISGPRATLGATRPRQRSLERSDSPDIFFNPFSWQRRNSVGGRYTRSRSATNAGTRPRPTLQRRSQRIRGRMIDVYDCREERRTSSSRYLRANRPHSGRTYSETRRANGNAQSGIPAPVRRFIDFAAEFIPVQQPPPDAEPPEWSLNVTAADFGPFAVGRSALSRARSLAIMGVLSQVNLDSTDAESNPNENEN